MPPTALEQISRTHSPICLALLNRAGPPPHLSPVELAGCQPLLPPDMESYSICLRLSELKQGGRDFAGLLREGRPPRTVLDLSSPCSRTWRQVSAHAGFELTRTWREG